MQEQIGKQGHRLSIELRDSAWSGHQRGDVTGGASDRTEDALAVTDLLIDRSARDRRQQPQEGCRAAEKAHHRAEQYAEFNPAQRVRAGAGDQQLQTVGDRGGIVE